MLIAMFLSPGTVNEKEQLFKGQGPLQMGLLGLALICVPWMLCAKPYFLWRERKKREEEGYRIVSEDGAEPRRNGHGHGHGDDLDEEEAAGTIVAEDDVRYTSLFAPALQQKN